MVWRASALLMKEREANIFPNPHLELAGCPKLPSPGLPQATAPLRPSFLTPSRSLDLPAAFTDTGGHRGAVSLQSPTRSKLCAPSHGAISCLGCLQDISFHTPWQMLPADTLPGYSSNVFGFP